MTAPLVGVDFSGAAQAGHGIWLADATPADDALRIETCTAAADRFGVAERAPCLRELTRYLQDRTVAGLDFPFGVPAVLHDRDSWDASLEWVTTVAMDADAFEDEAVSRAASTGADDTYVLRETDGPVGAKSPYHWLVAKQTFYGIRDVLAPIARRESVCVAPMQERGSATSTTLCEVYPAATLASLDLPSEAYKNDTDSGADATPARERRETIVDGLLAASPVELAADVRTTLLDDAGGDALDAVVAALATYRADQADFEPDRPWDEREGHIYV